MQQKSPLAEGVDDDKGTDVVVDALVDVIHHWLQLCCEFQLEIEPGFMGFFWCGEAAKMAVPTSYCVVALSHIFPSWLVKANSNREFSA